MLTESTITDEQIKEFGFQSNSEGYDYGVRLAHSALSVPISPSWTAAWHARACARQAIADTLNLRADYPESK